MAVTGTENLCARARYTGAWYWIGCVSIARRVRVFIIANVNSVRPIAASILAAPALTQNRLDTCELRFVIPFFFDALTASLAHRTEFHRMIEQPAKRTFHAGRFVRNASQP